MNIIPFRRLLQRFDQAKSPVQQQTTIRPPGLAQLAAWPEQQLPPFVRRCPVAMKYLALLKPLDWSTLPWRDCSRPKPGPRPSSPIPYIAAYLVKLDQQQQTMSQLRQYLVDHPALTWVLGFPLQMCLDAPHGFDVAASLPSPAYFSHVLRTLPNSTLQFLLADTVQLIRLALPNSQDFGQAIALDTKHIVAWVKENNPKAYIKEGRFDKQLQPAGDADCKLGCKRRRNVAPNMTPTKEGQPAEGLGVGIGEFYWGYASGVVATKVPGYGEFVLAESTQTFNQSDVSYFFPLMAMVEERLGFQPPYGTMDAAYDAFYVYAYFHKAGGFAAIPLVKRGNIDQQFDADGLPLCAAGLSMPLKHTFINRTSLIAHERGRYVCPLLYPEVTGEACPVDHKRWPEGGCTTTLPTSIGSRIRYQLDRESQAYKALYKQRTSVERIFSQAVALGIERPKLRNQCSITNQNTLIYILINLRALHRIRSRNDDAS
jgi:hypothetical protein